MIGRHKPRHPAIARFHSFYGELKMNCKSTDAPRADFPHGRKKKLPYVGSKLPCAVIRTESLGEVGHP